jgi:hypothetical protein
MSLQICESFKSAKRKWVRKPQIRKLTKGVGLKIKNICKLSHLQKVR